MVSYISGGILVAVLVWFLWVYCRMILGVWADDKYPLPDVPIPCYALLCSLYASIRLMMLSRWIKKVKQEEPAAHVDQANDQATLSIRAVGDEVWQELGTGTITGISMSGDAVPGSNVTAENPVVGSQQIRVLDSQVRETSSSQSVEPTLEEILTHLFVDLRASPRFSDLRLTFELGIPESVLNDYISFLREYSRDERAECVRVILAMDTSTERRHVIENNLGIRSIISTPTFDKWIEAVRVRPLTMPNPRPESRQRPEHTHQTHIPSEARAVTGTPTVQYYGTPTAQNYDRSLSGGTWIESRPQPLHNQPGDVVGVTAQQLWLSGDNRYVTREMEIESMVRLAGLPRSLSMLFVEEFYDSDLDRRDAITRELRGLPTLPERKQACYSFLLESKDAQRRREAEKMIAQEELRKGVSLKVSADDINWNQLIKHAPGLLPKGRRIALRKKEEA